MHENCLSYKGFYGSAVCSVEDMVLHGSIININDLVTYEAQDMLGLRRAFKEAVDDYIDFCTTHNKPLNYCQFCDIPKKLYKSFIIPVRGCMSDDNLCEKIRDDECIGCGGCSEGNNQFNLTLFGDRIGVGFKHAIGDITIHQYSETLKINYCPWCGRPMHDEGETPFSHCCLGGSLKVDKEF